MLGEWMFALSEVWRRVMAALTVCLGCFSASRPWQRCRPSVTLSFVFGLLCFTSLNSTWVQTLGLLSVWAVLPLMALLPPHLALDAIEWYVSELDTDTTSYNYYLPLPLLLLLLLPLLQVHVGATTLLLLLLLLLQVRAHLDTRLWAQQTGCRVAPTPLFRLPPHVAGYNAWLGSPFVADHRAWQPVGRLSERPSGRRGDHAARGYASLSMSRIRSASCLSRTLLLTTYYLLLTTYYSLLTTYYLLLTTYYLLFTTYYASPGRVPFTTCIYCILALLYCVFFLTIGLLMSVPPIFLVMYMSAPCAALLQLLRPGPAQSHPPSRGAGSEEVGTGVSSGGAGGTSSTATYYLLLTTYYLLLTTYLEQAARVAPLTDPGQGRT